MKKLVLAIAVAVLMATPAFAAVQNVKVSGNITSSYVNRSDFNLGLDTTQPYRQSVFLTQTSLRVDADLSDNVSTTVGLINERAWGGENAITNDSSNEPTQVNIYLAYVTLREFLYSPLTLTVGRQTFAFGNAFIFDATGTNNVASGALGNIAADLTMRTSLDAVRATLDYKPLTIDIFAGKASSGYVKGVATGTNKQKDDTDVYGINANYQLGDEMNTVVEAYVFGKNTGEGATSSDRADKIWVPGLRVSTNPVKGLNVQLEGALQRGTSDDTVGNNKRAGYAFQALASYAIPVAELEKYKTTVSGSYTYVSGDKNPDNDKNTTWDPMFENQNGGTIFNTLFNLSNLQIINATVSASPLADVTTSLAWNGVWAATAYSGTDGYGTTTLVQPDGSSVTAQVNSNRFLGNEFDANLAYQYTEDVKFGLNLGIFFAGETFTTVNDETAKQAIASVGVNF